MKLPVSQKDLTKTTRAERRKKLSRFKDVAKKCFGSPKSSGFGIGTKVFCLKCNNYPLNGAQLKEGLWYCKDCGSNEIILKSKDKSD